MMKNSRERRVGPTPCKNITWWCDARFETPINDDTACLVIVSGKPSRNVELDHAILLAVWYEDTGWCIEGYSEWENPTVEHFLPLSWLLPLSKKAQNKQTIAMKAVLYLAERNPRLRLGGTWIENVHDYAHCAKISFDEAIQIVEEMLYGKETEER